LRFAPFRDDLGITVLDLGGATTPRRSRAGTRVVVASALAACLSLLVSACGGSDVASPPSVNTLPTSSPSTAPTVTVTGVSAGVKVEIGGGADAASPGSGLDFVSPVYELGPSGPLGSKATVTMELDHAVPAGTSVIAATRESSSDDWSWLPATLTRDLRHAAFTTTHFSQFGVLTVDATAALSTFRQSVHSGLVSASEPTVEKPVCDNPTGARKGGWKAASWPRETLYWCFDLVKGKHVLTVVNRRDVPVQVSHGDATATKTTSKVSGPWTTWLGLVGSDGDTTFLAPGGSATYDAEIAPGDNLVVSTESDAKALSTRALYAAVGALVAQLSSYGTDAPTQAQAFASLVARPQCADALGQSSDVFVEGCLSRQRLTRVLGDSTQLLTPVLTASTLKSFWAKQFAFLAKQQKDVDAQHVGVSRKAVDFGGLVGSYTGHTRVLTISSTGLVVERLDNGTQPIIQLTYQLSGPTTKGGTKDGTTSAAAVLTRVTVYDRSGINGQLPKVGNTGTLSLHDGIITPPYLQTTYCDSAAAAKAQCGA
jgi:hypothetical protein